MVAPDYAADLSVSIFDGGRNEKERQIGSSNMYTVIFIKKDSNKQMWSFDIQLFDEKGNPTFLSYSVPLVVYSILANPFSCMIDKVNIDR